MPGEFISGDKHSGGRVVKLLMRQDIVIRGTTRGLVIVLPEEVDIQTICQGLREKLGQSGGFFRGAEVTVQVGSRDLGESDQKAIATILEESGMALRQFSEGGDPVAEAKAALRAAEKSRRAGAVPPASLYAHTETALVVTKTVRSGQVIRHEGDVIILGDVNPGAEVVASGHIVVMGALRGVAHAGSLGNQSAMVAATKLRPTQLRIAQVIGRAPDIQEETQVPEVARVRDGMIVVETSSEIKR